MSNEEVPQAKVVVKPTVHTVAVFVTYTRHEPYPAVEWASLMDYALKGTMEPVQVEAVTASTVNEASISHTLNNANKVVNEFVVSRQRRVFLLNAWPELHALIEKLGKPVIESVVATELTDPSGPSLATG